VLEGRLLAGRLATGFITRIVQETTLETAPITNSSRTILLRLPYPWDTKSLNMSGQFTDDPLRLSTVVFPHQAAQAVCFAIFLLG
jgi:hypothetical protein